LSSFLERFTIFGAFATLLSNFFWKDEFDESLFLLEKPTGISSSDETYV